MPIEIIDRISERLQAGDDEAVDRLTREAIDREIGAKEILDNGLIAGMNVIGDKFKAHEIFLPDVLIAARAMYAGMDRLKPLLVKEGVSLIGKVVIGTVQGDLHDIGKNLVGIMLKGAGFEVIDLGNDVPPERFLKEARQRSAPVIGMSALLTTTMPAMAKVVELVKEAGLSEEIRVIVGGAPVSESFATEIGADAYGFDAANAVDRVKELIGVN
jgi:5-methyltetrahydrofolate--homocysteine methyltransferase